ncbi:3-phosphoshikimate 1-carboxyvinyltransferase, partial [bacterium]
MTVPGDKSISHRAAMIGALARGRTEIKNFLPGADCLSTIGCFRSMGVEYTGIGTDMVNVEGVGLRGLKEPEDVLDVGNSGTTMRLMLGVLAGQNFFAAVTGDGSIRKRPMSRVTEPLMEMGASFWGRDKGNLAPLAVKGGFVKPIRFVSSVASAQVKSAILLAGLYARGVTSVWEPEKSRDHTERMLKYFGAEVEVNGLAVKVEGQPDLKARTVIVPGDISSAAFFLVAGAIVPGSEVTVKGVGINQTRDGIIEVLQAMGADLKINNRREQTGEPVADITVRGSVLRGTMVNGDLIPRLIDEIPVLAVAAAVADGYTEIRDAAELKVKETNRITTVIRELSKFGVTIEELPDGMRIHGTGQLFGSDCESHGDHRIAMAMA